MVSNGHQMVSNGHIVMDTRNRTVNDFKPEENDMHVSRSFLQSGLKFSPFPYQLLKLLTRLKHGGSFAVITATKN